jgi:hypothetical protein
LNLIKCRKICKWPGSTLKWLSTRSRFYDYFMNHHLQLLIRCLTSGIHHCTIILFLQRRGILLRKETNDFNVFLSV